MALKTFTINNGSANQALVTNGSGVLSFAAVGASAGQVIQVLSATDSTQRTTTSGSFVTASNTLSVSITPSSASNKILIIVTSNGYSDNTEQGFYTIFRGATDLGAASNKGFVNIYGGGAAGIYATVAMNFLDSPNTTSATTYQVYFRRNEAVASAYLNAQSCKGVITCLEIKG